MIAPFTVTQGISAPWKHGIVRLGALGGCWADDGRDFRHVVSREPALTGVPINRIRGIRLVDAINLVPRYVAGAPGVWFTEARDDRIGFS